MTQSSKSTTRIKPEKPYEGFPMFPHDSGQWCKKINRRLCYFGVWSDPDAALERLNFEYPYLKAGKIPPPVDISAGCTLKQLVNDFLQSKEAKLDAEELSPRTFRDYHQTCEMLIGEFGRERRVDDLGSADFRAFRAKLAKRYNPKSLAGRINRCRVVFNHAYKNALIEKPINYAGQFDKPSAKVLRRDRNEAGAKLFSREEILRILDATSGQLRAMCLLGINCAFGNSDVAALPRKAIDMEKGWVEFPRPKTEVCRRIPLWPETIEALKIALEIRPKPAKQADGRLYFLTKFGKPWVRAEKKLTGDTAGLCTPNDAIGKEFTKVLKRLDINGRRGLGFYVFRHTFETISGEAKDQIATDACMGHVDSTMGANYRHAISDKRLREVVGCVHDWLWPAEGGGE